MWYWVRLILHVLGERWVRKWVGKALCWVLRACCIVKFCIFCGFVRIQMIMFDVDIILSFCFTGV